MMNEFESKLEKLTRLTKAFEQADDSNKRSHLANELLCTLENTTLSARRYYSSFLKPEKHGREAHILPYHVEEHCALEVTRDGWTHIRLNTLLQSNRQRVTGYIESTLLQMLHDHVIDIIVTGTHLKKLWVVFSQLDRQLWVIGIHSYSSVPQVSHDAPESDAVK